MEKEVRQTEIEEKNRWGGMRGLTLQVCVFSKAQSAFLKLPQVALLNHTHVMGFCHVVSLQIQGANRNRDK